MIKENTFTLHRMLEEYVGEREAFGYEIVANKDSLTIVNEKNPRYVQPFLKELYSNCGNGTPQVLCIAATGASGKSALAEFISAEKKCPIFSLGNHPAVADSALVGVLYNSIGYKNISSYLESLQSGESLFIIDGADEGLVKAGNYEAFKTFLKGVADIAKNSEKTTFVILGRISAMEIVHLVLDEYGINTKCVRIEAFTEEQAREFINKSTGKDETDASYVELRNYILASIGDIFKNQQDIKTSDYQKFIGYAPVLMSIAKLIMEEPNPHRLFQELSKQGVKNIELLITIIESILERDKENKVKPIVLEELVKDRGKDFRQRVFEDVYSSTEQCYRVLAKVVGADISLSVTGDKEFDIHYEKRIKDWVEDHPFYDNEKRRIQNAVFESYIVATLIDNPKFSPLVYKYLQTNYKDAFMLFYIYDALLKGRSEIDHKFLPYLLASAHSLDDKDNKLEVIIEEGNGVDAESGCEVSVKGYNKKEYSYTVNIKKSDRFFIGDSISNTTLLIPSLDFELNREQSVLTAPITIQCSTLFTHAGDFQVELTAGSSDASVVIDCERVMTDFTNGRQYRFYIPESTDTIKLFSEISPGYPFEQFWENEEIISELTNDQIKVYQKLRKTMTLFKSHSKGRLAKYRAKIENRRCLGSDSWRFLLDALLSDGVLYQEDNFYFISPEKMNNCLGVSYDRLRCGEVSPKIVDFIKRIRA